MAGTSLGTSYQDLSSYLVAAIANILDTRLQTTMKGRKGLANFSKKNNLSQQKCQYVQEQMNTQNFRALPRETGQPSTLIFQANFPVLQHSRTVHSCNWIIPLVSQRKEQDLNALKIPRVFLKSLSNQVSWKQSLNGSLHLWACLSLIHY